PLVKQLFFLPFVKKVSLNNSTLIVERFDILEWEEVIQEVAEQIEDYLNDGGKVLNERKKVGKTAITIYAESTPNPSAMKFVANKKITDHAFSFQSANSAKDAPLVKELFNFPFIKEVFIDENYISISKNDTVQWEEVVMEIRGFIKTYLEEEKTILGPSFFSNDQKSITSNPEYSLNDTELEIVKILEEYVKPAVASDGGNIIFDSYEDTNKRVKVVLQGACSGCPSSTFTLKNGIENILKEMLPGKVETVEAVNG
ncbi:MAG: NifU N-terminal domain-containing protein, partial [Bacteroidota bacterium]|nr:NifU N-terminal domain-containing protein [Bacteroidota bacterium]